ncbi:hypothetical protein H4582DRAFT_2092602 [Lactarius indigo]|nr:hypothetical protein H4582DRAFT_2092602 [Lactarius indigo]
MSAHRVSSATPTGSGSLVTSQAVMKETVFEELKSAMFTVDLTTQGGPLQASPDDVQMVLDHLRHNCELTFETLFYDPESTTGGPWLPPSGFKVERDSYKPPTHLLNVVVHAANTCLTHARYLKDFHFEVYDVEMANILDLGKPLKPDILGLLHPHTPDGPKIIGKTLLSSLKSTVTHLILSSD